MSGGSDSKSRFSNRVANYVKYRPGYPPEVLDVLRRSIKLGESDVVVDIGSGTGLSAKLFLENGNHVYAVEPNDAMQLAAVESLGRNERFHPIAGSAEATGLASASADVIVAAQAFHWFDQDEVRREWSRILRASGWVVLIWNERRLDATPFLRAYEKLLVDFSADYTAVRHENVTQELIRAFLPREYSSEKVYNEQRFDFDGLKGRLLSSSYAPAQGHPQHEPMLAELRRVFDEHCGDDGRVVIAYDTAIHWGRLAK